jgi:hypothetical protein
MSTDYHIYTANVKLSDEISTVYINMTNDNLEAMRYIRYLTIKGMDITPLDLYKIDVDNQKDFEEFKDKFYNFFKPFEIDNLLFGNIYDKDIHDFMTAYIKEYPLDIQKVA